MSLRRSGYQWGVLLMAAPCHDCEPFAPLFPWWVNLLIYMAWAVLVVLLILGLSRLVRFVQRRRSEGLYADGRDLGDRDL